MSVRLVILGLLKEKKLYGYEIKSLIEQRMGDWTDIAFGSIYFALKKLTEEEFISQSSTEQHGNRPSRIVYQISERGIAEFARLLHETWTTHERQKFSFDLALFFIHELPEEDKRQCIAKRIEHVQQTILHIERHREATMRSEHIPHIAEAIFTHSLDHQRTELQWLKEIQAEIEAGRY